jgi:2-dehydro-3-deoxyphosphogluconate aldolase/(4S)-4-hydroxy-2-oxoglutarate aldolase
MTSDKSDKAKVYSDFMEALGAAPILPVLSISDSESAPHLALALQRAGIRVVEITLRTPAALEAIARMRQAVPTLLVGAGTVLNADDARMAVRHGAGFLVTPGTTPELTKALQASDVVAIPGVATASEAIARREEGFALLKLFPAAAVGGPAWLQALRGPLPDLRFIPTGGISEDDVGTYLAVENVVGVGGSWMVSSDDLETGAWDRIEATARRALLLGTRNRNSGDSHAPSQ